MVRVSVHFRISKIVAGEWRMEIIWRLCSARFFASTALGALLNVEARSFTVSVVGVIS